MLTSKYHRLQTVAFCFGKLLHLAYRTLLALNLKRRFYLKFDLSLVFKGRIIFNFNIFFYQFNAFDPQF